MEQMVNLTIDNVKVSVPAGTTVLAAAKQENVPARIESINTMIAAMERWLKVRLAGNPYNGKMKNFKFVSDESLPKFKRHVHKMNGGSTHRSSRH